jgi:type IV secretion system protein VirB4
VQKILSGTTNPFDSSSLLNFSIDRLLELNESSWRPVVDLLLHNLKSFFCTDIRPTMLILEEAWNLVKNPVFMAQINDWLRTLRKYNVSVFFISQTVADIAEHEFATLLRESCPTKIFLPNNQMDEQTAKGYMALGLNHQQTLLIRDAIPKQDYYLCSPVGNRMFNLDLGPLELSFLGKSMEDYSAISELVQQPNWLEKHLIEHGQQDWWNYVKETY